jgi:sigma-B regulation protein RsbU (phosphoserine phosphatase)
MTQLEKTIAQIPIFQSMSKEEIVRLSQTVNIIDMPMGSILLVEGEIGDRFYVIIEGQVEIIKAMDTAEESLLGVRKSGDYLGEMSLLNWDGRRTASARAIDKVQLIEITRQQFEKLLKRQPDLVYEMVREMSNRLTNSQENAIQVLHQKNKELQKAYDELKAAQAQLIEKERIEKELQVAKEIQLSILPRSLPKIEGYDLGALMVPAREVGGDFFDVFPLGKGHLGIVIGDVTDKGVPAAIYMAQTRALLRAQAAPGLKPEETLRLVNRILLDTNDSGLFVTVLYGDLDLKTGEMKYARAGHEVPILLHPSGRTEALSFESGAPLGIMPQPMIDTQHTSVHPGELLLLYTDGVTDGLNLVSDGFGTEELQKVMDTGGEMNAQAFCEYISTTIKERQAGKPQFDDVTLMAIKATS